LAPKKDADGYDPSYKYDYIYKCLIRNINEMTQFAELDLCGDETTCGHGGFGEADSGILARRQNKPGITFGMQTVIISDVHRNRPRAYTHRHKYGRSQMDGEKKAPVKFATSSKSCSQWWLGRRQSQASVRFFRRSLILLGITIFQEMM
jgi:hypothetical protein